jgi:membrane protein implicated in regulation of membrane protease activity
MVKNKVILLVSNLILFVGVFLLLGVWLSAFAVGGLYLGFEYYFITFSLFTLGVLLKILEGEVNETRKRK